MNTNLRLFLIAVLAVVITSHITWKHSLATGLDYTFEHYKIEFKKSYRTEAEHKIREMIYNESLKKVNEINSNKSYTWKAAINHLSDRIPSELDSLMGKNRDMHFFNSRKTSKNILKNNTPFLKQLPTHVDWREQGVTTPVKNQGSCGSCWAFSVSAVLESHIAINNSEKSVLVSPQELVDCVENPHKCGGTGGCSGATQELGFEYIQNNGISLNNEYPYFAKEGKCQNREHKRAVSIGSFSKLPENDYNSLLQAVAVNGPVAISVAASEWSFYDSGVFNSFCGTTVNHAVTLEGYGTDENGNDYWLVRNSWGEGWGEKGYIRVMREKSAKDVVCDIDKNPHDGSACEGGPSEVTVCGHCGILSDSSIPLDVKLIK